MSKRRKKQRRRYRHAVEQRNYPAAKQPTSYSWADAFKARQTKMIDNVTSILNSEKEKRNASSE